MLLGCLVLAAIAGGAVFGLLKHNAAAREEWRQIARGLGLELAPHSTTISGELDGHWVTIAKHYDGESAFIQVRVRSTLGVPPSINIKRAGTKRFAYLPGGSEIATGDESFDAQARVAGEEVFVLAALSALARRAVLDLLAGNGAVEEGDVIVCSESRQAVPADVRKAIQVAKILAFDRENPGERLLENLQVETRSLARVRCLEAFKSIRVSSSSRDRAIQFGLRHEDPRLRAEAAMRCGATAAHLLEAIAIDGLAPDDLRSRLIEHLAELERLPAIEKCVAMLERAGPRTTIALLAVLARVRDVRSETRAIALLGHGDLEVQLAAVRTLAALGTAASVGPLTELGGILDRELKREAARAIEKIRSRLGVVDTGRLSLAEEEAHQGALSVADREAGRLGLVRDAGAMGIVTDPKRK